MERTEFLRLMAGMTTIAGLSGLSAFSKNLVAEDKRMPVLFVGHGSPMNAIEDNEFSRRWKQMAKEIPVPQAVLVISAHWLTRGTFITAMNHPKTIHDFGGFPQALFDVQYKAPGHPELAKETASLIKSVNVEMDHDWGLDHGAWSVVKQMYPDPKIPVLQLSIDYYKPAAWHYQLAKELSALRKKGVLILASGNMVHNLGMISFGKTGNLNEEFGFDWAHELNAIFKDKIAKKDHVPLMNYETLSKSAKLAIPSPDHYLPLMYAIGLQDHKDDYMFFNDKAVAGSLTMTSVKFGS
jgi:4,5-DOPA dioxygenase extradiol